MNRLKKIAALLLLAALLLSCAGNSTAALQADLEREKEKFLRVQQAYWDRCDELNASIKAAHELERKAGDAKGKLNLSCDPAIDEELDQLNRRRIVLEADVHQLVKVIRGTQQVLDKNLKGKGLTLEETTWPRHKEQAKFIAERQEWLSSKEEELADIAVQRSKLEQRRLVVE